MKQQEKVQVSPKIKPGTQPTPALVVGIGASAGGLEAFEAFFSHMSPGSGIAFVLVPHLDPSHASMLTQLLARFTAMPVAEAQDEMRVEPDRVYIIPPNKSMSIFHGALQLTAPELPRGHWMPIDFFLRSLADDQQEKAVCIILSGTGTDGTLGLRAIQGAGGVSIVQEPATAKYDGMPASAIKSGLADFVLSPEKMGEQLLTMRKTIGFKAAKPPAVPLTGVTTKILMLIKSRTGHDFSLYKNNTIRRRIERRMNLHTIEEPSIYLRYLQENPAEVNVLFKELLITVTNFFREPDAFDVLKKIVLPKLLEDKPEDYTLRVWVIGCATGEEAYSLAMVIREFMDEANKGFKAQIFATDIDEDSIALARAGLYPANIAMDVSPERLRRFFVREEQGFQIKKEIREMVVFALQSVIRDAPFTRLDLISCRNLLIYLESELQRRLFPLFHYSLNTHGVLFLGSSESIGGFADLFTPLDKKWKVYQAKESGASKQAIAALPWAHVYEPKEPAREVARPRDMSIAEVAQKSLLDAFAPPSLIADQKGEILYIHGNTGKYLQPAPGWPSLNAIEMSREGLQLELRSAFHAAVSHKSEMMVRDIEVKTDAGTQRIDLTVRPLAFKKGTEDLFMVTFQDIAPAKPEKQGKGRQRAETRDKRIVELERELVYTRENLQATVEELQASNEELKSTNEELQSTNEELQSTNEELETSKEELQSVNEELVTVNTELESKIELLSRAENDMKNLLDNTNVGTVFLDRLLRIQRFTPAATGVISLIPSDIGRPLADIVSRFEGHNLSAEAAKVLDTLIFRETEIQTADKKWYLVRIMPYKTAENVVEGVVITLTDITQTKLAAEEKARRVYAEAVIDTVREPLLVLDNDLRVVSANRSFYRTFLAPKGETEGRYLYEIGSRQWDIPALRKLLGDILSSDTVFEDFEVEHDFPGTGPRRMLLNGRKIIPDGSAPPLILLGD